MSVFIDVLDTRIDDKLPNRKEIIFLKKKVSGVGNNWFLVF